MSTATNFSPEEINKFDQMAPKWWDENGPMKPLHRINPLRLKYIQENCGSLENKRILDIGCGGGILSESMAKLNAHVTGIDMAGEAINVAKLHAASHDETKNLKLNYINTSLEEFISTKPEQFDVITCLEMIEHVPEPELLITNVKKLLKPNGQLFISTLNRNMKSYLLAIIGAEYILNWIPKGTHEYHKFIKPSELAKILRMNNLSINNIKGITYSIFTDKFSISDDTDVNYITSISNQH